MKTADCFQGGQRRYRRALWPKFFLWDTNVDLMLHHCSLWAAFIAGTLPPGSYVQATAAYAQATAAYRAFAITGKLAAGADWGGDQDKSGVGPRGGTLVAAMHAGCYPHFQTRSALPKSWPGVERRFQRGYSKDLAQDFHWEPASHREHSSFLNFSWATNSWPAQSMKCLLHWCLCTLWAGPG